MPQPPLPLLFFGVAITTAGCCPQKITHTPLHDNNDGDDDYDYDADNDDDDSDDNDDDDDIDDIDVDNDDDDSHELMFLTSTVASGHKKTGCSAFRWKKEKQKRTKPYQVRSIILQSTPL